MVYTAGTVGNRPLIHLLALTKKGETRALCRQKPHDTTYVIGGKPHHVTCKTCISSRIYQMLRHSNLKDLEKTGIVWMTVDFYLPHNPHPPGGGVKDCRQDSDS